MKNSAMRALAFLIPVVLSIGLITGFLMRPVVDLLVFGQPNSEIEDEDEHENAADEQVHEEEHIALTKQAFQNLGLSISEVTLSNYTANLRMPGEIVESPGVSVQTIAAPVSGRVSRLFTTPGISVSEGVSLCELQIVDDQLEKAQLRLLELLIKSEIVDAELTRLAPLTSTGSVVGRRQLELEYQKKELDSSLARTRQELGIRGLSREQIESILKTRRVITTFTVRTPRSAGASQQLRVAEQTGTLLANWSNALLDQTDLTVEQLLVESGQNVSRGEPICTMAAHGLLSICGHAFENEIAVISQRAADDKPIAVEFGIGERTSVKEGLKIQYVASHVDESTQSFRFFVPLPNEIVTESTDHLGRRFRTWKYKVGQRVHLLVPNREVSNQIVVPRDAVVREGPDAFVFREHVEEDSGASTSNEDQAPDDEDEHEDVFIELEPVPVTVLYLDRSKAVIKPEEELKVGDRIAMGSGYQLLLALKSQESGGGHHHHHH